MEFYIKQNDTFPALRTTIVRAGSAVDLTGASISFHMRDMYTKTLIIDDPATIVDAVNGVVEYEWVPADTAVAGLYEAEFEVTFANGKVMTFPHDSYIIVNIVDDIA